MPNPQVQPPPTGYMHPKYAESFSEIGTPMRFSCSGGSIIIRDIPRSAAQDAMGCYPLFCCGHWAGLQDDIESLGSGLVTLSLVTDPFGDYTPEYLHACFPDRMLPFKRHYVIDRHESRERTVTKHHRYYARKALRELIVDVVRGPESFIDEWMMLHRHVVRKHKVTGLRAFSRHTFLTQLTTPGAVVLRALYKTRTIAAMIFLVQGDVVHAHMLGCDPEGYERGALYAILWHTFEFFDDSIRWCNLMGVPGASEAGAEGVRRFKQGWTPVTRMAYFCGRVLDRAMYERLSSAANRSGSDYFPLYRAGELL